MSKAFELDVTVPVLRYRSSSCFLGFSHMSISLRLSSVLLH
jgi:hypothetical protein